MFRLMVVEVSLFRERELCVVIMMVRMLMIIMVNGSCVMKVIRKYGKFVMWRRFGLWSCFFEVCVDMCVMVFVCWKCGVGCCCCLLEC